MRELKPPIETKFMRFVFLTTFIEAREKQNITGKMFEVVLENWLWYGINAERVYILTFGIILIVVFFRFQRKTALLTTADRWSDTGEYKQQFTLTYKFRSLR